MDPFFLGGSFFGVVLSVPIFPPFSFFTLFLRFFLLHLFHI